MITPKIREIINKNIQYSVARYEENNRDSLNFVVFRTTSDAWYRYMIRYYDLLVEWMLHTNDEIGIDTDDYKKYSRGDLWIVYLVHNCLITDNPHISDRTNDKDPKWWIILY